MTGCSSPGQVLRAFALMALLAGVPGGAEAVDCVQLPECKGCGCKGGPGYRGPDGSCVGYKALARVCGTPPGSRCAFENAPNAGINEACVLGDRARGAAPAVRP